MGRGTAHRARLIKGLLCGHPWGRQESDWSLPAEGLAEKALPVPLSYWITTYSFSQASGQRSETESSVF